VKREPIQGQAGKILLGGLLGLGLAIATAWLSAWPVQMGDDTPRLRVAFRSAHRQTRLCRPPTTAELAGVPAHMRRKELCQAWEIPYRLRIAVDEQTLADHELKGGGMRGDRPVFVEEEFPLVPGVHRVAVAFTPQPPELPAEAAGWRPADRERFVAEGRQAPAWTIHRPITFTPGRVVMLSLGQPSEFIVTGEQ